MSDDLAALIAERDALTRQEFELDARIKKIQDEKARIVLDRLAAIEFDLNEFARWGDAVLKLLPRARKGDTIFTLGKVEITFRDHYGPADPHISVRWGNSTAEFTREIPSVTVMRAFIKAILEEE